MVSGLWGERNGGMDGKGQKALALCLNGAPASPSPLPSHFSVSPLPPHLWPPLPQTPSSYLLQGAILTTMLATRNFSGRW